MFPCRPLVSPPLPRALAAAAPVSVRRLPWASTSLRVVRCMAKERRVRMVAKQIQRELADMLTRDPVMQRAVLPEAALGADRYLSSLTTIADVELSNDLQVKPGPSPSKRCGRAAIWDAEFLVSAPVCLQVCKVYVSVFGDERGKKVAMAGLKDKTKYVRSQIGKRMKLRLTPEIRFIEDESMERGSRILTILDKLKEEREQREGNGEEEDGEASDIAEEEDGDWEGDEPDEEDIIYVK
ncbi:hypothetical protein CFC21_107100 [Triticum aestivum]|uniref:Ribosome-binding factor A n=2 Tax=Triticum aestivum TaxID=4565 RepID=A0A9R1MFC5_WHEAT|nr:hypothetical protein CFC21_107092 [Triticum aestivum]KAF7106361.1 hypothetical protein CFC21_107100 [Triticum aestivum]